MNLLPPLRPCSSDLAAAYDVSRLDLEDVGKVASKGYLKLKTHRFHAVVGDVEIFVQATAERSTDSKADGARRDWAIFGEDGLVGEVDARCVVANGTAVQQLPRHAVSIDRPVADDPRVEEV